AQRVTLTAVATVASYGLAILGFVMMASAVLRTLASNLKYVYTRPLIINALRTNANHAENLCKTAPDSYFGAIGAALKTGGLVRSAGLEVTLARAVPALCCPGLGRGVGLEAPPRRGQARGGGGGGCGRGRHAQGLPADLGARPRCVRRYRFFVAVLLQSRG